MGVKRVNLALDKKLIYREGNGIMNPKESAFSVMPEAWLRMSAKNLLKEYEEARKRELEFDPRQHRLKHGIRNFDPSKMSGFKGKGVKLG